MNVLDAPSQWACERTKEWRKKIGAYETTTVAWLASTAALVTRERKNTRLLSKTLSSPRMLSLLFFPALLWILCLCGYRFGVEQITIVDMWTSLDTFSRRAACPQICPRQQFWTFFFTSMAGPHVGAVSPRCCSLSLSSISLCRSRGEFKKKLSSWSELTTFI